MKHTLLLYLLVLLLQHGVSAQTWHVSGTGNDSNNGKTAKTAFRTLQKAADLVQPGDVVLIGNGIYTNNDKSGGSAVLNITRSGRPDAWITWKATPEVSVSHRRNGHSGQYPDLRPIGWAGIQISGSYHILDGLTVTGSNDSLTLIDALAEAKNEKPNPTYNTNGIFINGRTRKADEKPHHVTIRNCTVRKCPGGGITAIEADYFTIEDCQVSDNGWYMRYAGSGITSLNNWAFDDKPGYHVIIQRNYVWNNKTLVPWNRTGKLSDGNGILLDVTDQEGPGATNPNADAVFKPANGQTTAVVQPTDKPKRPEWKGRALIANNLSAYNGGSGIHTFRTSHVDIVNNTTYHNGSVVGYQELFPNRSNDVVILNNIIVPRPGGKVTSNNRNTTIRWDYNLYPTAQEVFKGPNDIVADPQFIDVQPNATRPDPTKGNFRLAKSSRAQNSGSPELPQATDITGKPRPRSSGRNRVTPDRGTFEEY